MSFENTHISAVRLFCVTILIVFEENIIEETFGIVGHLVADNIEACIGLAEWELLASKGSADHADCEASLAVSIGCF